MSGFEPQTHSDQLPGPGVGVENVQVTVGFVLSKATVHKQRFGVGVKGRRVAVHAGRGGAGGRGVNGKPEVLFWKMYTQRGKI